MSTLHSSRDTHGASVLVALDGSPAAETALPFARAIATQLGAQLEILHVAPAHLPNAAVRVRLHLTPEEREGAEVHLRLGEPAAGILDMARAPDSQLIVLTTHGRVVEHGRHLGRVAEAVIAATSRPILLVRPEAVAVPTPATAAIQSMLFPLDGTPTTFSALRPATDLACRLHTAVDLLYVVSPGQSIPAEPGSIRTPCYVDQPQHEWPQWSREATERLITQAGCPNGVPARAFLAFGDVGAEVLRFADEYKEDIIVLVRRSHLEPERARVLRAVLDHTPCPVLLLAAAPAMNGHLA